MDIRLKHLHKKLVITLSRKWIPGFISVLHIKVSLLQRENTKKIEETFGILMLFPKKSAEMSIHDTLTNNFRLKTQTARWNRLQTMSFLLSIHMLNFTVFRFIGAKLHFRFHNLSVFWHAFYWISYAKYLSNIELNVSFSWHISSLEFSINKNRLPSDISQERKYDLK